MQTNILDWLEATAARCPDAPAVGDVQQDYTWAQLAELARRSGSALAARTAPRCPAAFYLEKSASAFAAMLGTVYAGCCYSVLDPRQPAARTRQVLDTLAPALLITDAEHADAAAKLSYSGPILPLESLLTADEDAALLAARRVQAVDVDPLYINFTSGSTGVPKGVTVSHRSVLDFIPQFAGIFGINGDDILGNQAPFDFDVSVKDLYTALYTGAKVQIIPRAYFSQPTKLMDYLADHAGLGCQRHVLCLHHERLRLPRAFRRAPGSFQRRGHAHQAPDEVEESAARRPVRQPLRPYGNHLQLYLRHPA